MTNSFAAKYGPWALVTGASRGLGAEFARQCAERGLNIIQIATNADLLKAQADAIIRDYGVEVRTIALDLSREDILPEITPVTDSLEVGLLVNNAGISRVRPFLEHSLDQLVKQLHVNTRAGLVLAYHFGRKMAERRRGGIIFLSSGSAMCGTAYCANYAGTKAYNLVIAESLWYELRRYGVDVLGFMAGSTKTPGLGCQRAEALPLREGDGCEAGRRRGAGSAGEKTKSHRGEIQPAGILFNGENGFPRPGYSHR